MKTILSMCHISKKLKRTLCEEAGYALTLKQLFYSLVQRGCQGKFIRDDLTAPLSRLNKLPWVPTDDFTNLLKDLDLNSTKFDNNASNRN